MDQKVVNTFEQGMNLDLSDMIMSAKAGRFNQNIRLINLSGSSYVVSNIGGTEQKFQITAGFKPVAAQEFNGVLYIISWNDTPASPHYKKLELGSYPSPGGDIWQYRPLNNLDGGAFRTNEFDVNVYPIIQKLEIQPDYDQSVNMVFTIVDHTPRIVNTKFKVKKDTEAIELEVTADRPGSANSNTYTTSSVAQETSLVLFTDVILKIAYGQISSGGKLKPGNYVYIFQYMTEDFNKTGVIGQSSICQIAFGNTLNDLKGGDETQETDKRVILSLSSVDTNFRYLKVYVLYSSGQESVSKQTLEFTQPIPITGVTMNFNHTGFEELAEVSADTVNIDYAAISSAYSSTQIGGYYMLGGVSQRSFNFQQLKDAAAGVTPSFKVTDVLSGTLPDYADPRNVYEKLPYMGGESYPFGMVFVLPGGVLSPAFPISGKIFDTAGAGSSSDEYPVTPIAQADGVVTFPLSSVYRCYKSGAVRAKYLEMNLSSIPLQVKQESLGFFFVRGERNPWMLTQGLMIPTLAVPPVEWAKSIFDGTGNVVYENINKNSADTNLYKRIPLLDNLLEAYFYRTGNNPSGSYVMNNDLQEDPTVGRMPIYINDLKGRTVFVESPPNLDNIPQKDWALLSGEALLNEPSYIGSLRRTTSYIHQLGLVNFFVQGAPSSQFIPDTASGARQTGMYYEISSINNNGYTGGALTANFKKTNFIDYVIAELFATGSKFISKLVHEWLGAYSIPFLGAPRAFRSYLTFNSYFGVEMSDSLIDSARSAATPISGNYRIANSDIAVDAASGIAAGTSGPRYHNIGTYVPGGFLANVYPNNAKPYTFDAGLGMNKSNLYPSIDTVAYKQCSPWYTWSDIPTSGPMAGRINVFGGDCYISKVSRKLYQSGFRNSASSGSETTYKRANMPAGMVVSWYQESKYNLYLRQDKQFDDSETMKRSFFPLQSKGSFKDYQQYRYPETLAHSQGYSEVLPPKVFFSPPSLTSYIETEFFSRVYHSERHIPSAFKNGYRSFLPSAYRDYDSSMGRIVAMFNHRGKLLIIFQHGMGITDINQRIQTGGDAAGSIFVEPSDVLPPTIQYISREIGCQHHLSLVQTPSAVYGVDKSKDKLWCFSDSLNVISDNGVSSFILGDIVNPRTGYDFQYSEVLFTTDNWTLCFREGMNTFTSFYSFKPNFYARRNKDLYSFPNETQAHLHNAPGYLIYGEEKNAIIEFVVNTGLQMAKVLDYLNVISNEVPPNKVEFYTYNQGTQLGETINVGALNQYVKVENVYDPVDDDFPVKYRDKKFVIQVPTRTAYGVGSAVDDWGIDGRIRDKYIIVRLTYLTTLPLELASVVSSFRYSRS